MKILTLAFFALIPSCAILVPDSFMVGQGVGSKADGTFLYFNYAIPQPE